MKKTTIMFALMLGVACTASAQKTGKKKAQKSVKTEQVSNVSSDQEEKLTLAKEVYPQKEENSNLYHGLTKKLTFDRMIPPHGLEVTYDKTVHILFPASVKHIGSKRFGIQYLLKGIYVHSDLLYFHTEIKNQSNVPFDVDYITFKVVDKKVAKRTAIQEQVLLPVRAYNYVVRVAGKKTEQTVFCLPKFTIPDGKELVVEMNEKEGGRHQSFVVENSDLVRALTINELSVK